MFVRKAIVTLAAGAALLGAAAGAQAQTVKIGLIAPMTGAGAAWGIALAEGGKIRAAEINARGGMDVGGKKMKVEVIAYDDQYKASEALAAYNRLVTRDGVKNIVVLVSASAMALKKNIEDDKIVTLTGAFASKAIDSDTKFMNRAQSIPVGYMPPLASWLKGYMKERRIALVNPNDETGWEQNEVTKEAFKREGFDIVAAELFERSQKDFQPLVTRLISLDPQIIDLGTCSPATAGLLVRQARELGYKGLFLKTGGPGWQEILEAAGNKNAEGIIGMGWSDTDSPGYKRIAAEYKKAIGQEPNVMIATYYDAVAVLLAAMEKSGDPNDTVKVAAALEKVMPMPSVQGGDIAFKDHHMLTPVFMSQMKDGVPVIIAKLKM